MIKYLFHYFVLNDIFSIWVSINREHNVAMQKGD
jgi:hypothetical protein